MVAQKKRNRVNEGICRQEIKKIKNAYYHRTTLLYHNNTAARLAIRQFILCWRRLPSTTERNDIFIVTETSIKWNDVWIRIITIWKRQQNTRDPERKCFRNVCGIYNTGHDKRVKIKTHTISYRRTFSALCCQRCIYRVNYMTFEYKITKWELT